MSFNNSGPNNFKSEEGTFVSVMNLTDRTTIHTALIRFEEKREKFIWTHPDEIYFVKSADHYVRSLIKQGIEKKWMSRHSTLKDLLKILPAKNFIRLNKFYLLNLDHFSHINEAKKILYFNDDTFITIPHRISPFLRHLLKSNYT